MCIEIRPKGDRVMSISRLVERGERGERERKRERERERSVSLCKTNFTSDNLSICYFLYSDALKVDPITLFSSRISYQCKRKN